VQADSTFIERVTLSNYRSFASCDVSLRPLMFLVGPNGAGKSNFLDALSLIAESLRTSLGQALLKRGGIEEVRRRSPGHPNSFDIRLDFRLRTGHWGHYWIIVGESRRGAFGVNFEECVVFAPNSKTIQAMFMVQDGLMADTSLPIAPQPSPDRLYLVLASGLPEFRPVYDALSRMGFYNFSPDRMREPQPADLGELLAADGRNIASVLALLKRRDPVAVERINEYLSMAVPGIHQVAAQRLRTTYELDIRQSVTGSNFPWRFSAAGVSDGTLRALGVLTALLQTGLDRDPAIPLVGIEEPELGLHPAAVRVLLDAFREASQSTQVIVSSHSPDLLDDKGIETDSILAVSREGGNSAISPVQEADRQALKAHLFTAGELLRMNQLTAAN
jgi:predicted ATPase